MIDKVVGGNGTDILYHLGLDTLSDLSRFSDTRFVVMGGSPERAASWAEHLRQRFAPTLKSPLSPFGKTERFTMFKVGPIISASHGIGMPSMRVLLHEMAKLMRYAGACDVVFIRVGTSGGIGSDPGTIIVSTTGMMGTLEPEYELIELGERRRYSARLDEGVAEELICTAKHLGIPSVKGATVGTDDFYEGQGRLDGALQTSYTEEDKMKFLQKAYEAGARNIEMEAPAFGSFCLQAGIHGAIVCCSIVNRLKGDQIESTPAQLSKFSADAQRVVTEYMEREILKAGSPPAKRSRT